MGFCQNILVSSLIDGDTRQRAIQSARTRWNFLRLPHQRRNVIPDRLLLAMPELTEYLYASNADYEAALELHDVIESELETWSRDFPQIVFIYMQADCFGG